MTGMIVTMGEILVDILAEDRGQGFREPGRLLGPFPGGAPATFTAQAARLGADAGIISCVGDDDFGWLCVDRLKHDGVDVSAVRIDPDQVTASAFVRYREDGDRDFLFNLKRSAAGRICIDAAARGMLAQCAHFHIMGTSLFSFHIIDEMKKAIELAKANGAVISFDPNIRKEMLTIPEMRAGLEFMLGYTDIFMPSGPEILLPTEARSERAAIEELLGMGIRMVVHKRNRKGVSFRSRTESFDLPAFAIEEADPTGAGDCFDAAFVTCLLTGMTTERALTYANAAGALAASKKGGMEGIEDFATLDRFIATAATI
ncbi:MULTISPECIES: sugar kinase [Acidiphilium]|uniref:Sugar or nucleoside kinase, ribokinase family n=1 Tax=Acidiphilium rubrum TaxID=526 RepID=A0A8G2CLS5_ACIRU|nr:MULTISPECIES: sugar kinase [Acidiphilium]SIR09010.1 Sugar or nucleoside kinase, ribokinase family [Acidiphilium rubrum]